MKKSILVLLLSLLLSVTVVPMMVFVVAPSLSLSNSAVAVTSVYNPQSDESSSEYQSSVTSSDTSSDTSSNTYTPIVFRNDCFATATGLFNDIAYYNRSAMQGDVFTLKVGISESGENFGLDYSKITVVYTVEGAEQITENYVYTGNPDYVDGIATDFRLGEGFNQITAHIYYNGFDAGTCEPFYIMID